MMVWMSDIGPIRSAEFTMEGYNVLRNAVHYLANDLKAFKEATNKIQSNSVPFMPQLATATDLGVCLAVELGW